MKKFLIFIFFLSFNLFSTFAETYGQIQNRFTLWYRESVWVKLDEKVNTATDTFNNDKTRANANFVVIWACARYAYWRTVRQTAQLLYEQFGDKYGEWKYSVIFDRASDLEKKYSDHCYDISSYFLDNYSDWDFYVENNLGLYGYYGDLFNIATRL